MLCSCYFSQMQLHSSVYSQYAFMHEPLPQYLNLCTKFLPVWCKLLRLLWKGFVNNKFTIILKLVGTDCWWYRQSKEPLKLATSWLIMYKLIMQLSSKAVHHFDGCIGYFTLQISWFPDYNSWFDVVQNDENKLGQDL